MKIPTTVPVTAEQLQQQLAYALPQYKYTLRTKKILVVEKSAAVGANVVVAKNKVNIVATFPNMGAMMAFTLCVVFLGVLLPLLVYFIAFYGRQKAVEQEVGRALQAILAGNQAYAQQQMQAAQQGWQPTA
jgi:hypothetical protein